MLWREISGSSLLLVALLSSSTTAWPWPGALMGSESVDAIGFMLWPRQNSPAEATATPTATGTATPASSPAKPTDAVKTDAPTTKTDAPTSKTDRNTASTTAQDKTVATTKTDGGGDSASKGKPRGSSTQTSFDLRLPPGGIHMITPAAAATEYYKVGDFVTLAWNYTSLSVSPSAIDVVASCSANQATYTLALNQSVEETGRVVWDTGKYQATGTIPLLTAKYTLIIYDSNGSISDPAQAGYLGTYSQFYFGMYTPQAYTPLGRE